ncbi:MAG: ribosomal protein S18-alanine N-acetyltransferase [Pseudomonadota bacterium]
MNLREASAADIASVSMLDRRLSPVFSDELAYRRLLGSQGLLVLADDGGELLGFAALSLVLDEASLLNLVVAEAARRRGCATKLLSYAATRLAARNVRRVLLEVRESNSAALALYTGCGFNEDGRRPAYYPGAGGGEREAAILMSQSLSTLREAPARPVG